MAVGRALPPASVSAAAHPAASGRGARGGPAAALGQPPSAAAECDPVSDLEAAVPLSGSGVPGPSRKRHGAPGSRPACLAIQLPTLHRSLSTGIAPCGFGPPPGHVPGRRVSHRLPPTAFNAVESWITTAREGNNLVPPRYLSILETACNIKETVTQNVKKQPLLNCSY